MAIHFGKRGTSEKRIAFVDTAAARLALSSPDVDELVWQRDNEGLYRWDGYEWKSAFNSEAPTALTTIYVNSVAGNDGYIGNEENPLASLAEAASRITEGFSDGITIQLVGAGPYTDPGTWPNSGGGGINIIGDRSNPIVSGTPSWSAVAGTSAQQEDASFGIHSGLISDGYWAIEDLTLLGFPQLQYQSFPIINTASPAVRIVSVGPIGFSTEVHEFITTVNIPLEASVLDAGIAIQYHGVIAESTSSSNFVTRNYHFYGCKFPFDSGGQCATYGGTYNGYFEDAGSVASLTSREGGTISGIIPSDFANLSLLDGASTLGVIDCDNIFVLDNASVTIGNLDYGGSNGIIYYNNCNITFSSSVYLTGTTTNFVSPNGTDGNARIVFDNAVTGSTTGTCVQLTTNCSVLGVGSNLDGTLTNSSTPGNEIQVGIGAPIDSFSDLPISDATTFCRGE